MAVRHPTRCIPGEFIRRLDARNASRVHPGARCDTFVLPTFENQFLTEFARNPCGIDFAERHSWAFRAEWMSS